MSTAKVPVYRQAQVDIKEYIQRKQLKPGDALPPEERFAQEIGVGRLALREALKALDSLGIVESRHGEGVFVKAFSFDAILDNLPYAMTTTPSQMRDLVMVRFYLECGAIHDIAGRVGPETVQNLRGLGEQMLLKARAQQSFSDEDRAFHLEMHRCLNNSFLNSMIELFWRVFQRLNDDTEAAGDFWMSESRAAEHLHIVDMLEQRDVLGLQWAHRKHFQTLLNRYPSP